MLATTFGCWHMLKAVDGEWLVRSCCLQTFTNACMCVWLAMQAVLMTGTQLVRGRITRSCLEQTILFSKPSAPDPEDIGWRLL